MLEPMKRTEILYSAMKDFTDARIAARAEYFAKMKPIETAKGSKYYNDARKEAEKARRATVDEARAKAADTVDVMIASMRKANSVRAMAAPTEEQLRILQALKMREKVTLNELDAAANAMCGNGAGLAVVEEIAQNSGVAHPNYNALATAGLSIAEGERVINNLLEACKRVLNGTGATRAAELNRLRQADIHNEHINPDDLPQEPPYESVSDFYARNISTPYDIFSQAVDN
ncbi:MAG: hypothetical protein IKO07_13945 [Clostridia bacterium]|nr:hypothetical protein [Clostridia bacterium]